MTVSLEQRIRDAVEALVSEAEVSEGAFAEIERRIAAEGRGRARRLRLAAVAAVLVFATTGLIALKGNGRDEGSVASGFEKLSFDFEGGAGDIREPVGWTVGGLDEGFQVRAVDDRARSGRWSARVAQVGRPVIDGGGLLKRCLPARGIAGRQVQLTGYIATEGVAERAAFWLVATDEDGRAALTAGAPHADGLMGTNDFTSVAVVADVPTSATELCVIGRLDGAGTAWFDDVTLEVLGPAEKRVEREPRAFTNLDFDGGVTALGRPRGWRLFGRPAYQLETTVDDPHRGPAAGRLRSDQPGYDAAGTAETCSEEDDWVQAGSVTVTAWLRPIDIADGTAYLKLTAYGDGDDYQEATAMDRLSGNGPWRSQRLSIEVPRGTEGVCLQLVLTGAGAIDIDEVELSRER